MILSGHSGMSSAATTLAFAQRDGSDLRQLPPMDWAVTVTEALPDLLGGHSSGEPLLYEGTVWLAGAGGAGGRGGRCR